MSPTPLLQARVYCKEIPLPRTYRFINAELADPRSALFSELTAACEQGEFALGRATLNKPIEDGEFDDDSVETIEKDQSLMRRRRPTRRPEEE